MRSGSLIHILYMLSLSLFMISGVSSVRQDYVYALDNQLYRTNIVQTDEFFGEPRLLTWSPTGHKIAFDTQLEDDIWLVDIETSELYNLTKDFDRNAVYPQWSNNADTLFFIANSPDSAELDIWSLSLDKSTFQNLSAEFDGIIMSFNVAPDNQHIAFAVYEDDEANSLWILELSTLSYYQINPIQNTVFMFPMWLNNTEVVISKAYLAIEPEIWFFDIENNELIEIPAHTDYQPLTTLQNTNNIVGFIDNCEDILGNIGILQSETGVLENVTDKQCDFFGFEIVVSPDNTKLVYTSQQILDTDISVIDLESGQVKNLTQEFERSESSPAWSPDSKQIALISNREDNIQIVDIWIMDVDGSNPYNLTQFEK